MFLHSPPIQHILLHKKVLYCHKFTTDVGCGQLEAFISEVISFPPKTVGLPVEVKLAETS